MRPLPVRSETRRVPAVGQSRGVIPGSAELLKEVIIEADKADVLPVAVRVLGRRSHQTAAWAKVKPAEEQHLRQHRGAGAAHASDGDGRRIERVDGRCTRRFPWHGVRIDRACRRHDLRGAAALSAGALELVNDGHAANSTEKGPGDDRTTLHLTGGWQQGIRRSGRPSYASDAVSPPTRWSGSWVKASIF